MQSETKKCKICGEFKPLTSEFFCRDRKLKCGFSNRCKTCKNRLRKPYALRNREAIAAKVRAWALANPDRRRAWLLLWRQSPSGKASARRKKKKNLQNPIYRLKTNVSGRLRFLLRGQKSASWQRLVGYTAADLRRHLERQFIKGMSWENYGSAWVVDHIIPVRLFKFPEELRACWALTNLRPLWKTANNDKGGHRQHLI
jgi:hypothetical protein